MSQLNDKDAVRPTRRALNDLLIALPPLEQPLHEIDDPHVAEMQKTPERVQATGAERIRKITDRVWWKYKSGNVRAAVGQLRESEVPECVRLIPSLGRWWIAAAGPRQEDSGQRDFYAQLENTSDSLLPVGWDEERLVAELSIRWLIDVRETVRQLIKTCLLTGQGAIATTANHEIQARVLNGDEMYLVLGAHGIYNPEVIAVILDSVPGVSIDDWLIEPSGTLGVTPNTGEIIWSTILPEETRLELLEDP